MLHARAARWRSADGGRSIQGEFVKRDATERHHPPLGPQREVTIPLDKLHPDDRAWLNANHPLPRIRCPTRQPLSSTNSHSATTARRSWKNSRPASSSKSPLPETFFGRTGLNGVFRTRKKSADSTPSLYFDWTENGGLKEITLQTPSLPASDLDARLTPVGRNSSTSSPPSTASPSTHNDKLDIAPIPDGSMTGTHLWKLENRGTAMLGAARDGRRISGRRPLHHRGHQTRRHPRTPHPQSQSP